MKIALVGGSGLVGKATARALIERGHTPVILDRAPPPEGLAWVPTDLLRDDLESALGRASADRVLHLVARVDPPVGAERGAMRKLHVEGTRRLVRAARALGLNRFVLCSSAVVYGAWPDNPVPLDEERPLRPRPDFPYGVDKAAQEDVVLAEAGSLEVAIGRPAIIYSGDARNYLTEFLRLAPGVLPCIDGQRPLQDFVHVDDVGEAFAALLTSKATGAFNLPSAAPIAYEDVARVAGLRLISVPSRVVGPVLNVAARFAPSWARAPRYVLDHLTWPFVMSGERAKRELGWVPKRTAEQALRAMLSR